MKRRQTALRVDGLEGRELMSVSTAILAANARRHVSFAAINNTPVPPATEDPPPFNPGPGDPTALEVARQKFRAAFSGPMYIGPAHYTGQSKIIYIRGTGTSNQFLHGDFQLAIPLLKDSTAQITAGAYMQDRNVNSGAQLGLDLYADMTSLDRFGRPTRFTFIPNSNIMAGIYYDPHAKGTVTIRYFPGKATVLFDGRIFTNGLSSPLRNQDIATGHSG